MSSLKRTKSSPLAEQIDELNADQKAKHAKKRKLWLEVVRDIEAEDTDEDESEDLDVSCDPSDSEESVLIADEDMEKYVKSATMEWLDIHGKSLFNFQSTLFLKNKETDSKNKKEKKKKTQ